MHQDTQTLNRLRAASARAVNANVYGVGVIYMLEKVGVRVTGFGPKYRLSRMVSWTDIEQAEIDPLVLAHNEVVEQVTEDELDANS